MRSNGSCFGGDAPQRGGGQEQRLFRLDATDAEAGIVVDGAIERDGSLKGTGVVPGHGAVPDPERWEERPVLNGHGARMPYTA